MAKKNPRPRQERKKRTKATSQAPSQAVMQESVEGSAAKALGPRLRQLRTQRSMSQGDIEKRTGLLRCYVSRVENGFTIPGLDTLEKFAAALQIPLHAIFRQGKGVAEPAVQWVGQSPATTVKPDPIAKRLRRLIGRMDDRGRQTLFNMMRKLAARGA